MINEIYSDLETFRKLRFKPGLNILVAEKHELSGKRDTRNGTGKTSMVELVHFLVQERKNPADDFHKEKLLGYSFGATFDDNGEEFSIERRSRAGKEKDEVQLNGRAIDPKELRNSLAENWFSLSENESSGTYAPKFGALLSYFARKERNGGFSHPRLNAAMQNPWDSQINIAYLLGFDWQLIQQLQILKDKKKSVDNLAKIVKEGYLSDNLLDLNEMQSQLDFLDGEVERRREEIASTTVLDSYRDHEYQANNLTAEIRELNEGNLADLDLQENIDLALHEVADASVEDIRTVYKQVGLYFPEQVQRRFDEVVEFHKQMAQNRQTQLSLERQRAAQRVKDRRNQIDRLQSELKEKLSLLRSGVAIDRWTRLQSELNALEMEAANLRQQIPRLRNVIDEQQKLKRRILEHVELIDQDVQARDDARKFAVQTFAEISRYLYDEPGRLILGRSKGTSGLEIDTDIVGKKSGGKSHMQIFCFDWTLTEASKRQGKFPGFLIHDSHIFDGVDGRQIGLALSLARMKCEQLGIQYIVAMNSDDLEKIKTEEESTGERIFDPTQYIMDTRLSDDEAGGLFGTRF